MYYFKPKSMNITTLLKRIGGVVLVLLIINSCQFDDDELNSRHEAFSHYDFSEYDIEPLWDNAIVTDEAIEVPFTRNGLLARHKVDRDTTMVLVREVLYIPISADAPIPEARILRYIPLPDYTGGLHQVTLQNYSVMGFEGSIQAASLDVDDPNPKVMQVSKEKGWFMGNVVFLDRRYEVSKNPSYCRADDM